MNIGKSGLQRLPRQCRRALVLAVTDGTPWRALKLAAVVGTLLVAINQWEALLGQAQLSLPKVFLTFLVPYLVSTYTSVSKDLQRTEETPVHKSQSHG